MHFTIDAGTVLGMLGVGFCFASFAMKRMLTLRVLALVSNVCPPGPRLLCRCFRKLAGRVGR